MKFIEFNWNLPAMGNGATDAAAGSINMMFDFHRHDDGLRRVFLSPAKGTALRQR